MRFNLAFAHIHVILVENPILHAYYSRYLTRSTWLHDLTETFYVQNTKSCKLIKQPMNQTLWEILFWPVDQKYESDLGVRDRNLLIDIPFFYCN